MGLINFGKIKSDEDYRIKTFLCVSLIFNVIYSVFLFVVCQIYHSRWFFVMSIYHGLLSVVRLLIFAQARSEKSLKSKFKTMRVCGFLLLLINLVVSTMTFILIYGGGYVKHHEITVIALATYVFYSLGVAIYSSVKYFRQNNCVYFSAKIISFTAASVSLVTLTNAMLATFGEDNLPLRSVILPLLCGAVAILVIVFAIYMIIKANSSLRMLKNEKE